MWHRCKGRCANIRPRSEAKHCSSLCSQSEGGEYCGGQALKIQQSHAPERWSCSLRVRGPHFASKVSYNAGAPSSTANNSSNSLLRRPRPKPSPHLPPQKACNPSLQSPHREFPNRQALLPYIEHLLPRQMRFRKTFLKPFRLSEAILCFF